MGGWALVFRVLTAAILLFAAVQAVVVMSVATTYEGGAAVGMDLRTYMMRTDEWLDGGSFYRDRQLHGPYVIETDDSMYPPTLLYLTVPFALGLPAILWWLIPGTIIAVSLRRIRPPRWTWPVMAFVLLLPRTSLVLVLGNPAMWAVAAAFAGVAYGWPWVLVVLKPTFAPLALLGVQRRSWWLALAVFVAVSLPLLPLWFDYAGVLLNAQNTRGLEYTLGEWPLMLAPLSVVHRVRVARSGVAGVEP